MVWVLMNIQPNDCLRMELQVKEPGLEMKALNTHLDAGYCSVADMGIDAYEALLLDVIEGDHALFLRYDEVDWAWRVLDPVLKHWADGQETMHTYPAGSWGPKAIDDFLQRDGRMWRNGLD